MAKTKVDAMWEDLHNKGYFQKDKATFDKYLYAPGEQGYKNRKALYDDLHTKGYLQSPTYEDFAQSIGLHAVNNAAAKPAPGPQYAPTDMDPASRVANDMRRRRDERAGVSSRPDGGAPKPLDRKKSGRQIRQNQRDIEQQQKRMQQQAERQQKYTEQRKKDLPGGMERIEDRANEYLATGEASPEALAPNPEVVRGNMRFDNEGRLQQSYMTPDGDYSSRAGAEAAEYRNAHPLEDELQQAYLERDRLQQELNKAGNRAYEQRVGSGAAFIPAGAQGAAMQSDPEFGMLSSAYHQNELRIKALERERDATGFWRTLGKELFSLDTWDFGAQELMDAGNLLTFGEGDNLTPEQREARETMLLNTFKRQNTEQQYGDNDTFMQRAATITANAIPFVVQFLATGGMGAVTSGGAKLGGKMASAAAARGVANKVAQWMLKNTGVLAGDIAAGFIMANTVGGMATAADIIGRHQGQVVQGPDGTFSFEGGKNWGRAIYEGEVANTLEYYTEMLGAHLDGAGGAIGAWFAGTKLGKKIGIGELTKVFNRVKGSEIYNATTHMLRRGGFNEYPSEVFEEEANLILNSLLVGDNQFSDLADGKTQLDIWGGMLLSVGFMQSPGVIGGSAQAAQYYRYKQNTDIASEVAASRLGESRWASLKEGLDDSSNDEIMDIVQVVMADESLIDDDKRAVMNYVSNLIKMRGYNLRTMADAKDKVDEQEEQDDEPADTNDSFHEGYNAPAEKQVKINDRAKIASRRLQALGYSEEDMAALDAGEWDTAWLKTLPDNERIAVLDYVNAGAAREGMIQHERDNIDLAVADSDAMIDGRTHKDGTIVEVGMKSGGQAFVWDGDVARNADGSVDTDNSSSDLIIVDAESGERQMVSINDIASVEEPLDANQLKAEAAEEIRQTMSQAAADRIDGTVAIGQTYQIPLGDGQVHDVVVLDSADNNNYLVQIDGAQEAVPMSKADLQDAVDQVRMSVEPAASMPVGVAEEPVQSAGQQETTAPAEKEERFEMPMDEQGEPAWNQVAPKRGHQYLYKESGWPQAMADNFVQARVDEAEKALKKVQDDVQKLIDNPKKTFAENNAAMAMYTAAQQEAQAALDYWKGVQGIQAQATAPVVEETAPVVETPAEQEPTEQAAPVAETEAPAEPEAVEPVEETPTVETEQPEQSLDAAVTEAAAQTDTNPTDGQKEAGNYKKGHVKVYDFNVTIEQPKGSVRSGMDADGNEWSQEMHNTYGYIRGTEGVDGDHIDVFLSDHLDDWNQLVFVVDQVNKDGSFDEHKVMLGFNSTKEAEEAYLSNYEDGWTGLGNITVINYFDFKDWINSSHRKTKPFAEYKIALEKAILEEESAQNESRTIQGLDGYTEQDVLDGVRGDIEAKLEDAGVDDVTIKGMALHGSRMRGDARDDSDLDVVIEYEGNWSEDSLFDLLNEEPVYFDGVKVDINPITRGKSGTLEQYMERSRRYDEEKTAPVAENEMQSVEVEQPAVEPVQSAGTVDQPARWEPAEANITERGRNNQYGVYLEVGNTVSFYTDGTIHHGDIIDFDGDETFTIREWISKRNGEFKDVKRTSWQIPRLYGKQKNKAADVEAGGAVVDQLQKMGVDINTDLGEYRTTLSDAKKDNSEAGTIKYMKTSDGTTYGFTYRGKIHIDPRKINADLPLHEYGHLWGEAVRKLAPDTWKQIVDVLKSDADTWNFLKARKPELTTDDAIADEMIAEFSGKNGEQRLKDELERMSQSNADYKTRWGNIFKNIVKAIQDFWKSVGDFLHIDYKTPQQIYDQVLKDFASGMNPRERVERYLKERDADFVDAVNRGDTETATRLFNEALTEEVGNGMTPFISVGGYGGKLRDLARKVKNGNETAIEEVADIMAPIIPKNAVLIPASSHTGRATYMLDIANAIAKRTGSDVADILVGPERARQYDQKKETGKPIASKDLGVTVNGEIPEGKVPVVLDNVVATGNTAEACVQALGKGIVCSLAKATDQYNHVASLKSANVVVRDSKGNVIPLSKRFDLSQSKRLGNIQFSKAEGDITKPVSEQEAAVRDALIDVMREAGIDVITDTDEGQRVLDEANGTQGGKRFSLSAEEIKDVVGGRLSGKNYGRVKEINPFLGLVRANGYSPFKAYREVFDTPTIDDYYIDTRATFKPVDADWERMKASGKYEWHQSPKSNSEYLIDRENGDIYRRADHWGLVASCYWKLDGDADGVRIGMANIKDFKPEINRDNKVRNDELDADYSAALDATIANYETLLNGDIEMTRGAREMATEALRRYRELKERYQESGYLAPQNQVRFSLGEESQKIFDTAKRKFGETKDIREAGYVLPDGVMLDFSGRHELDPGTDSSFLAGRRTTDHRAVNQISFVYDEKGDEVDTGVNSDMPDFIKRGAIRIDNNAGLINLSTAPTSAQKKVLRQLIAENGGDVQVDFGDGWDSDHYVEYDQARPTRVLGDIDRYFDEGLKPEGNIKFFRTEGGEAYGFVKDGKVYIDQRIATTETPIHEYGHLWGEALRQANPKAWEQLSKVILEEQDVLDYVKQLYPELEGDQLVEEVFNHYSGRRGRERLEREQEEMLKQADGVLSKAKIYSMFAKIKSALQRFWQMARDLFAGKTEGLDKLTAEDFADMMLNDLLNGVDPRKEVKRAQERLNQEGVITGSSGDVRYSWRYRLESEKDKQRQARDIRIFTGATKKEVKRWQEDMDSMTAYIMGDLDVFDYPADSRFVAIKKNSDYPQGTVDFNNICPKRKDMTSIWSILQRENPGRIFTALDLETIRQTMIEDGLKVACGLCFVEDRRQRLGEIAQDFIDNLKADTLKPEVDKLLIDKDYIPSIAELIDPEESERLHSKRPDVYNAFVRHNNACGQQAGRLFEGYAEYKREILKWTDKKVKAVNDAGGLRIFSFSDFDAPHLLDIMQIIADCAARGVKIQGYTKVPEFARAVRNTGLKLNRSLIPKGTGIKEVDGKKVLDYDTTEGIDVNDPNFLDEEDNPNVGNILVGINDEQIRLAMVDPFVDFIIPFHTGLPIAVRKKKGIDGWKNYKNSQRDKDKSTGKAAEKEVNIYTDVLQAAEAEGKPIRNKRQFVEKFLQVCNEKGLIPRYSQFLDKDENGNFIYTEGYHKFPIDFKMFDRKTGRILPQQIVRPDFDDAFNKEIMDKYAEGTKVEKDYSGTLAKLRERLGLEAPSGEGDNVNMQGFGSAGTSLNQVARAFRHIDWKPGTVNVDIGGGRFDRATEYLAEKEVENLVFDPFNRDAEHNRAVAERVREKKADTVTCNNVLNVIDTERSRANVILQAAKALKPEGTAYFSVYEGDKSGVGRQTKSDSWQNNRPTKDYIDEVKKYFDDVTLKNNIIIAKLPKATYEQSVWDFDGTYSGNSLAFETGSTYNTKDGRQVVYKSLFGGSDESLSSQHNERSASRQNEADRIRAMSDDELLRSMTESNIENGERDFYTEEYDRRHIKEYNAECDRYRQMLEENEVTEEQADDMLVDIIRQWKDNATTAERTTLLAQFDTINDYYNEKVQERQDREWEDEENRANAEYLEEIDDEDLSEDERIEKQRLIDLGYLKPDTDKSSQEEPEAVEPAQPVQPKPRARKPKNIPTALRLRPLEEGEQSHVERRYVENNMFDFTGTDKIESAADIAYIFRQLETSSVENVFLVLIKKGKPTIIHVGMGGYTMSVGNIGAGILAASAINPDHVVMLHNHPSGNLAPSAPDRKLHKKVEDIFGSDKVRPSIIIDITSGKYAEFTHEPDFDKQGRRSDSIEGEVSHQVYSFSKMVFDKDWDPETAFKVTDSSNIAAFVSSHRLGEHDKVSLIVLDHANHIVGNIFLPWTSLNDLKAGDIGKEVSKYIHQMGGTRGVLYGSGVDMSSEKAKAVKAYLQAGDLSLLDCISVEKGSYFDRGMLYEPDVEYGYVHDDSVDVTPAGDFSVRDQAIARDTYEKMLQRSGYQFQEAVQDSMLSLKRLYQAVLGRKTRIEDVPDNENAYMAENHMSSINAAEQHEYFTQYMKPLLQAIHKIAGKDADARQALVDYMMAKHGLERNLVLADRDAQEAAANGGNYQDAYDANRKRDYAGLTALMEVDDVQVAEALAQQLVDDYEQQHDTTELWDRVKAATGDTLYKMYSSGLMSKETYDKTVQMFEYYIPLRGWDETTSDEVYGYLTDKSGPLGSPIKHAKGRASKADDPIATIALMADDTIRAGNRNLMKQRFLIFAQNHPSDLVSVNRLWLQYNEAADEWEPVFADIQADDSPEVVEQKVKDFEERMEQLANNEPKKYKRGRDAVNIPYKVVMDNLAEHQVLVKRGGETYVLTINGNPRAAQALNGMTNPDVKIDKGVVRGMYEVATRVNRELSAFYTTRNPDFIMSNFLRDTLYSNCMTWVKESPNYALKFHKNFGRFNPAVLFRLFQKWENGTLDMNNPTEAMFKQFMLNGGETGYTNVKDIEGHKRTIAKELKRQSSPVRKGWHLLGEEFDVLNRAVENCARFAAFVTSREMGRSIGRSVHDAKEVSVNFNKKGAGDKMFATNGENFWGKVGSFISGSGRLFYIFWNAGVQGMTNFGRAFKRNPKKASAGAASMFLLGTAVSLLAQAMGGDDDDDKDYYYNLPENVRRSNICFRIGKGPWITIPLPIEFRAIYGLGEMAVGVITGKERYSDSELAYNIVSQLSQLMPLDLTEGEGGWANLLPQVAKTPAELMTNRTWYGMPIYKDTPFNKEDPEWTKAYSNANQTIVAVTKWLNELTGGNDYKKGWLDINPAQVEYALKSYFGGVSTTIDHLMKSFSAAFGEGEFNWRDVPLASRVLRHGDERTAFRKAKNEYFNFKAEAEETKRLLNDYQKDTSDPLKYAQLLDMLHYSPEYGRYIVFEAYNERIEDLRKAQKENPSTELEQSENEAIRDLVDAMHKYDDSALGKAIAKKDKNALQVAFDSDSTLRKVAAKEVAKQQGLSDDKFGEDSQDDWSERTIRAHDTYRNKRNFFDASEDAILESELKKAKDVKDKERAHTIEQINTELNKIRNGKNATKTKDEVKGLGQGEDDRIMEELRAARRKVIEDLKNGDAEQAFKNLQQRTIRLGLRTKEYEKND